MFYPSSIPCKQIVWKKESPSHAGQEKGMINMKICHPGKPKTLKSFPWKFDQFFIRLVDRIFEKCPRPVPSKKNLNLCRIISHRGVYDNSTILENTLEAVEGVKRSGIWGVEIDIRWTKDLVPVVIHDRDLKRLFDAPVQVSEQTVSYIKTRFPGIPALEEVVNKFGKDLHLMVEIKKEHYPDPVYQNKVLKHIFRDLQPVENYHLLSLNPEMFDLIGFVPPKVCLTISTKNVGPYSRLALNRRFGGITGHYLLVSNRMILRHHQKNQKVGTGFVQSLNCLFRELNRGVDWIFSDNSVKLQAKINALVSS
jgi:glycerophosphoryl diester phosphodiesterase